MKIKLIAALTLTVATAIASPVKAYTTAEANFLSDVFNGATNAGYGEVINNTEPASLLNLAYTTCTALDNGASFAEITRIAADSAWQNSSSAYQRDAGGYIIGYAIGSGVQYLCPRHYSALQSWLNPEPSNTYYPPSSSQEWEGQWATLTASDRSSQINVRSTPSLSASSPHYGLAGDSVWVTRAERRDGYNWYFVGFPGSGASGWVRGDFVEF